MSSTIQQDIKELIMLYMEGLSWTQALHKSMQESEAFKNDEGYDEVMTQLEDYNTRAEAALKKLATEENVSA